MLWIALSCWRRRTRSKCAGSFGRVCGLFSPADAGCRGKNVRFYSRRLLHLLLICWEKITPGRLSAAAALMPFKSPRSLHRTTCRLRQRHISGIKQVSPALIVNLYLALVYSNHARCTMSQLDPQSHFAGTPCSSVAHWTVCPKATLSSSSGNLAFQSICNSEVF